MSQGLHVSGFNHLHEVPPCFEGKEGLIASRVEQRECFCNQTYLLRCGDMPSGGKLLHDAVCLDLACVYPLLHGSTVLIRASHVRGRSTCIFWVGAQQALQDRLQQVRRGGKDPLRLQPLSSVVLHVDLLPWVEPLAKWLPGSPIRPVSWGPEGPWKPYAA